MGNRKKNQFQLAGLKRVFKRFIKVGVAEVRGQEEDEVVLSEVLLLTISMKGSNMGGG